MALNLRPLRSQNLGVKPEYSQAPTAPEFKMRHAIICNLKDIA